MNRRDKIAATLALLSAGGSLGYGAIAGVTFGFEYVVYMWAELIGISTLTVIYILWSKP